MIGSYKVSQIANEVRNKIATATTFAEASVLNGLTPLLEPNKLYVELFGSKKPIEYAVTYTPKLKDLINLWSMGCAPRTLTGPKRKDSLIPPHKHPYEVVESMNLQLPVAPTICLSIVGLKNCLNLGEWICSPESYYYHYGSGEREKKVRVLGLSDEVPQVWVDKCRALVEEAVGAENMEAIDRIINLRSLLSPIPDDFRKYAEQVRSLGGLYRKLPVLNSLVPNPRVEHVTMTRQTPDPPPDLIERLNIAATLYTASISAKATTGRNP